MIHNVLFHNTDQFPLYKGNECKIIILKNAVYNYITLLLISGQTVRHKLIY